MEPERLIKIADQMYECRREVKRIYGDEWKQTLVNFKEVIRYRMKVDAIDEITSAIRLASEAKPHVNVSLCFMAAAVDMVEPE